MFPLASKGLVTTRRCSHSRQSFTNLTTSSAQKSIAMAPTIQKLIHPFYRDVSPLQLTTTPSQSCFPRRRPASRMSIQSSQTTSFGIMSLPDEIILLIFRYLGAERTICTLGCPRYAYNFAITHTRFLVLFRTLLTRVNPNVENEYPKTLSKRHLLSVVRLAGPFLKEISLPRSARDVLYHLPSLCPSLRILSFVDCHDRGSLPVKRALMLPLTTLHITDPAGSTLSLITHPPDQLYLTRCMPFLSKQLDTLLENPPRKFYLQIRELEPPLSHPFFQTHLSHIFDSLERAVNRIEDLTFRFHKSSYSIEERHNQVFLTDAQYIVTDTIRSQISSCRRVVLEGDAIRLIRLARPDAEIVLQDHLQSFTCVDGKLYPVQIPLWDAYMTQDLSYVHTVIVGTFFNLRWRKLLANNKLRLAIVQDPFLAGQLQLSTTVLEVQTCELKDANWQKFRDVREVRLVGPLNVDRSYNIYNFFDDLTHLLNQFQGKVVWLLEIHPVSLYSNDEFAVRAVKRTLEAVDRFESYGGDAGAVRAFISQIKWKPAALAKIQEVKQWLRFRWETHDI